LIEAAGAMDVYFEETIEILVQDPSAFEVEAVERVLEENEVKFSAVQRSASP
jgi:hypothetical protein